MAVKKKSKKTSKKAAPSTKKKVTIVNLVEETFRDNPGISTQAMMKKVKAKFPDSKFQKSHVAYYANKMRKGPYNIDIPVKAKRVKGDISETKIKKAVNSNTKKKKATKKKS